MTYRVDNPYTGQTWCEVPALSCAQAMQAVERSAAAQRDWRTTSLDDRLGLCERFLAAFAGRADKVAADITGQMGKPLKQALGETAGLRQRALAMMELAPDALAPRKEHARRR